LENFKKRENRDTENTEERHTEIFIHLHSIFSFFHIVEWKFSEQEKEKYQPKMKGKVFFDLYRIKFIKNSFEFILL
jgi:hypothetical protein